MSASELFRRGDIVRLKSGGRAMAVEEFDDKASNIVRCKWFDGNARYEHTYYTDALEHHPHHQITPVSQAAVKR